MFVRFPLIALILTAVILSFGVATADEGMWPLQDLGKLPWDSLKARGLQLTPEQIYDGHGGGLAVAVVDVGSSGSFVSADGLAITNHHVAFGAIQRQSTPEHNYLRDGFYAPTRDQELRAYGYHAHVLLDTKDVTARVLKGLKKNPTDVERSKAVEKITKQIIKESESGLDVQCEVAEMYGGRQYIQYFYMDLPDIRIVYVPPAAIGNFGGDIDNWMWPRHVGDFSFLRAYIGPDGRPAEYAKENVPYRPKSFLRVSGKGVKEGDLTMIIGNPSSTNRYESYLSFKFRQERYLPKAIRSMSERVAIMTKAGEADSAIALRLEARMQGVTNYLKKFQGMVEGFAWSGALEKKRLREDSLRAFLKSDPKLEAKYGSVLAQLDSLFLEQEKTEVRDFAFGGLQRGSDLYSMASFIYKRAVELQKPDAERQPGYQDRDETDSKDWLEHAQINLIPSVDRQLFRYALLQTVTLPEDQRIKVIDSVLGNPAAGDAASAIDACLEKCYGGTRVGVLEDRMRMFTLSRTELEKLHDPLIDLARALRPDADAYRERARAFDGAETRLKPLLVQAYEAWRGKAVYPDANGTTRINFGEVRGYSPRDGIWYNYATTLKGVFQKETGQDPFIVPDELKQAGRTAAQSRYFDPKLNDVPVNFITTNDGTNGNSGSPVINGKGELIGLDFDTNYEGVGGDYLYDSSVKRAVVLDMQYMLYIIDDVYHLDALVRELTIH
jgi:hypothetical protein